jgi:hypothetical protein
VGAVAPIDNALDLPMGDIGSDIYITMFFC